MLRNNVVSIIWQVLIASRAIQAGAKLSPPTINYLHVPEPYVCPPEIAVKAGYILTQNWCDSLSIENLNVLQAGLYNSSATLHALSYDPVQGKCVDTGVAPYLGVLIPMIHERTACAEINPTSVMVDSYNRLIVYAESRSLRNGRVTDDELLFIMEPSCSGKRGCSYKIIFQQYYDRYCLSQLLDSTDSNSI